MPMVHLFLPLTACWSRMREVQMHNSYWASHGTTNSEKILFSALVATTAAVPHPYLSSVFQKSGVGG
jgi:hypothetical protein